MKGGELAKDENLHLVCIAVCFFSLGREDTVHQSLAQGIPPYEKVALSNK